MQKYKEKLLGVDAAGESGFGHHFVLNIFGYFFIMRRFHVIRRSSFGHRAKRCCISGQ
ncbi:MAG: hypothetical protein HW400_951, partial [Candidatus Levybacteria bacterium]|nr:hypothetical protein [Candidatus Levybacteria bacterium]